jgi:hypothetical protein
MRKIIYLIVCTLAIINPQVCHAEKHTSGDKQIAQFSILNKFTTKKYKFEVEVGEENTAYIEDDSLAVTAYRCYTYPSEEKNEDVAFINIDLIRPEQKNLFTGWVISSSKATSDINHIIYDVWLEQCITAK